MIIYFDSFQIKTYRHIRSRISRGIKLHMAYFSTTDRLKNSTSDRKHLGQSNRDQTHGITTQHTRPWSYGTRCCMRPLLLLLLPLSCDCHTTATVYSMGLASGVRDAAIRARIALVLRHIRKTTRSALAAVEEETPRPNDDHDESEE